jgi:hypothetical protein
MTIPLESSLRQHTKSSLERASRNSTCSRPLGSRCPDLKRFLNNVAELPVVTDNSLAIHRNAERSRSILAANAISLRIRHFKGVYPQGDRGSTGDSAILGSKAAGGLARDQSTTAVPERPASFTGILIVVYLYLHFASGGTW